MCGIYAYLRTVAKLSPELIAKIKQAGELIQYRGPDNTKTLQVSDHLFFGFHRLAINGLSHESDEPLFSSDGKVVLICNGEIFNFKQLIIDHKLPVTTKNDCEVIIYLYMKYGIRKTVEMLDGDFSFILYDAMENSVYVANDPIGVRPLFQGKTSDGDIAFASEPIALRDICDKDISFFPPGCYQKFSLKPRVHEFGDEKPIRYFHYAWILNKKEPHQIYPEMRQLLESSVKKRLLSDRPIACLLSGGLDSSIVCALVAKFIALNGTNIKLHTFSIGMPGSPDLYYAQIVAKHIGSVHHNIEVTSEEFLAAIPEVIQAIQSWDITSIRASVGNYLIAKYIRQHTDFKVIFNGDGSEEIWASYFYSRFAPSDYAFFRDNVKLIQEVHRYDVLRSARCVEHFGLESRTPFLDKALVNYVMEINPKYKRFGPGCEYPMEKMLMRNAFQDLLPPEIIWRPKTAFSDGVSKKEKSWHQIVSEYMNNLVSDQEFAKGNQKFLEVGIIAPSKEAYYYQKVFIETLGDRYDMIQLIQEYWMPRFVTAKDPSARELGSSS